MLIGARVYRSDKSVQVVVTLDEGGTKRIVTLPKREHTAEPLRPSEVMDMIAAQLKSEEGISK
jgi:hypothetical protein